ncbi:MAG: hypothetical protein N2169_07110 [bacterium]|nr:hypothetical protein [bacterium]
MELVKHKMVKSAIGVQLLEFIIPRIKVVVYAIVVKEREKYDIGLTIWNYGQNLVKITSNLLYLFKYFSNAYLIMECYTEDCENYKN